MSRPRPARPAAAVFALLLLAAANARSEEPRADAAAAADSIAAAARADSFQFGAQAPSDSLPPLVRPDTVAVPTVPLDTLATPMHSPSDFLWDALAETPGAITLAPRAVTENDPMTAANLLERIGILEMTFSGAPGGVPEWYSNQGLGPGWVGLRIDGLDPAPAHSAAPLLDLSPLETAGAFLWVPGPLAALAGTGAAGGALLARMPDDRYPRSRSLVAASQRYYDTGTGALSFQSPNEKQGFGFHYSDRGTGGREAYGPSWMRTYGGQLSRVVTDSMRAVAWADGFEGRTRLYDGSKLERRGHTAAAGVTRPLGATRLSLSIRGAHDEYVATTPLGTSRRRGSELGGEANVQGGIGSLDCDASAGGSRVHETWRDRGTAVRPWDSTLLWGSVLASAHPRTRLSLWAGGRLESESGMSVRLLPAAAAQWDLGGRGRVWAAASRGYGDAAYPAASNDLRTITLQGLGLLDRSGTVSLPEARRFEVGGAFGSPGDDRWGRLTAFRTDLRDAFVGAAIADPADRFLAGGSLDSLRADASIVGLDAAARWPIAWGFYARAHAAVVRDAGGGRAEVWVVPPESGLAALGLRRLLFKGDLLADAELIGRARSRTHTPFVDAAGASVDLDAATIVSFRVTGDVLRRFHLFYEADNILNELAASRTFVPDIGTIYLPGRSYSLGVLWRLLD